MKKAKLFIALGAMCAVFLLGVHSNGEMKEALHGKTTGFVHEAEHGMTT